MNSPFFSLPTHKFRTKVCKTLEEHIISKLGKLFVNTEKLVCKSHNEAFITVISVLVKEILRDKKLQTRV